MDPLLPRHADPPIPPSPDRRSGGTAHGPSRPAPLGRPSRPGRQRTRRTAGPLRRLPPGARGDLLALQPGPPLRQPRRARPADLRHPLPASPHRRAVRPLRHRPASDRTGRRRRRPLRTLRRLRSRLHVKESPNTRPLARLAAEGQTLSHKPLNELPPSRTPEPTPAAPTPAVHCRPAGPRHQTPPRHSSQPLPAAPGLSSSRKKGILPLSRRLLAPSPDSRPLSW